MPGLNSRAENVTPAAPNPGELEPDPESIREVMDGNVLIRIAAGLLVALAVFALLFALG